VPEESNSRVEIKVFGTGNQSLGPERALYGGTQDRWGLLVNLPKRVV
jgi:hypothetical protein